MTHHILIRRLGGKRRYLLWDTYVDPRIAGAVNGTKAVPPERIDAPPVVRTVTDTENKLSIV